MSELKFEDLQKDLSFDSTLPEALKNNRYQIFYSIEEAMAELKSNDNNGVFASAKFKNGDGHVYFLINEEKFREPESTDEA